MSYVEVKHHVNINNIIIIHNLVLQGWLGVKHQVTCYWQFFSRVKTVWSTGARPEIMINHCLI